MSVSAQDINEIWRDMKRLLDEAARDFRTPAKPIYSLSGVEMDVRDDDRILLAIMDTEAGPFTTDIEGKKLIGPENAIAIREALKDAGFQIIRQTM